MNDIGKLGIGTCKLIYWGSLGLPVDILCRKTHIYCNFDVIFPVIISSNEMVQSCGTIMSQCIVTVIQNIRLQGIRNHNSMKNLGPSDLSVYNTVLIQMTGDLIFN